MKVKTTILKSAILTIIVTTILFSFTTKNKISIDGAWSSVEVKTVKPNGTTSS